MGFVSTKECSVKMEADGRGLSGPGQFTPRTSDQGGSVWSGGGVTMTMLGLVADSSRLDKPGGTEGGRGVHSHWSSCNQLQHSKQETVSPEAEA